MRWGTRGFHRYGNLLDNRTGQLRSLSWSPDRVWWLRGHLVMMALQEPEPCSVEGAHGLTSGGLNQMTLNNSSKSIGKQGKRNAFWTFKRKAIFQFSKWRQGLHFIIQKTFTLKTADFLSIYIEVTLSVQVFYFVSGVHAARAIDSVSSLTWTPILPWKRGSLWGVEEWSSSAGMNDVACATWGQKPQPKDWMSWEVPAS